MVQTKIKIEGMACEHCEATVARAISAVDGVSDVKVVLADKQATVTYDPERTKIDAIKAAVKNAGYIA
ncbi:MAG: heavy-metal-associated domain-containing protein [Methanosarcinaceae archaeon]|nr:heavy-metal-associated domain-containing protein [Methanosarcinaceae archaeon]